MSPRYIRNEPDRKDDLAAALASGVLAASVGLVAFYVARLFLARDEALTSDVAESGDGAPWRE